MPDREPDAFARLNAQLDALTDGIPTAAGGLERRADAEDPALLYAFARLRRLEEGPPVDAECARRLWEDLMHGAALAPGRPLPVPMETPHAGLNGHVSPQPWRMVVPGLRSRPERGPSLLVQAGTLLLVAAVVAVFVVVGPARVMTAPPFQAPTQGADAPGTPLFTTLAVPEREAGPLEVAFWRASIAPGAEVRAPADWAAYSGTEVELVLSGALTLQADATLRVARAAQSPAETGSVPAGEPVQLAAGDAAVIPFASARTYRNAGNQPVELLRALVFTNDQPAIETMSPADGLLIRNGNLVGSVAADAAPEGPLQLTLSRMAGAEHAWPAQTIRPDGVLDWRMLESLGGASPSTPEARGTVYVLTLAPIAGAPP